MGVGAEQGAVYFKGWITFTATDRDRDGKDAMSVGHGEGRWRREAVGDRDVKNGDVENDFPMMTKKRIREATERANSKFGSKPNLASLGKMVTTGESRSEWKIA